MFELEIIELANGIEVRMTIERRRAAVFDIRRRNLAGRTGCGICGVDRPRGLPAVIPERVAEVRERCAVQAQPHGLEPDFIRRLYTLIIDEACRLKTG